MTSVVRTGGASWTQVGRAASLSKQGAQQRWGRLTTAEPAEAGDVTT